MSSSGFSHGKNFYQGGLSLSYTHVQHLVSTSTSVGSSVLTVAIQEAALLGAGVAGTVGCTVDPGPSGPDLSGLPAGDNADGDSINFGTVNDATAVLGDGAHDTITVVSGDGNILAVGDGASDTITVSAYDSVNHVVLPSDGNTLVAGNGDYDALTVYTGDNNVLWAGDGASDYLKVGSGSNNDLHAGNGAGDFLQADFGDHNCLTVGDGANDGLLVYTGSSDSLTAGNGDGDALYVSTGDNNLMTAGNGNGDWLYVGTGYHNSLSVGDGANNILEVNTGDHNFLHAGDGAGDILQVTDGDSNALIAGNGAGDHVIVVQGDGNVLAVGDGSGDVLQLGFGGLTTGAITGSSGGGDDNILLQGNGTGDYIFLGGANFDSLNGGHLGQSANSGNVVVMGNGDGDQAWGSPGDNNSYLTGAGNDLVHTGGGSDFVYVDNHTETATPSDPYHLTSTDSLAQNLYADGGNDTFAIQGANANSWHNCGGSAAPLGTTVMTGGGGAEKYWVDGAFGNAVVTDFNSANGDRVMVGGVWDGTNNSLASMGPIHTQYIHSAYDTGHTGNVDLLITFNSGGTQGSITLIDFLPQDTGGAGGTEQFNNVTFSNTAAAESTLAHIFDFNQADNQAVAAHVASLAAANLILH